MFSLTYLYCHLKPKEQGPIVKFTSAVRTEVPTEIQVLSILGTADYTTFHSSIQSTLYTAKQHCDSLFVVVYFMIQLMSASKDGFNPSKWGWPKQLWEAHSQSTVVLHLFLFSLRMVLWRLRYRPRVSFKLRAKPNWVTETVYSFLSQFPGSKEAKRVAKSCYFSFKVNKERGHKRDISHKYSELKQ